MSLSRVLCLLLTALAPSLAAAQGAPVMLRLQLAVCEELRPGFPTERLATGSVTLDGVTAPSRWPSVPISLPESVAAQVGLLEGSGDERIVFTSVEDGQVLANGEAVAPKGRAFLTDICAQLARRARGE